MSTYGKSIDFLFNQMRNGSEGSLAAGTVYFYAANTTTPKAVWTNRAKTLPTVGGIYSYVLTADGTAELFGDGLYYIVVKDADDVTIYDYDYVSFYPSAVETAGSDITTVDATSSNQTYTLNTSTPQTVIRLGATSNYCRIYPPNGYTLASGAAYRELSVANESVTFNLVGTIFYEA